MGRPLPYEAYDKEAFARICRKVSMQDTGFAAGPCWVWEGFKNDEGYGRIKYRKKSYLTHRLSYILCLGPIQEGLQIDHLCRNTGCCNPEHIEAVTPKVNANRSRADEAARERCRKITHCKNGHLYTEENTYISPKYGSRSCKICRAAANLRSILKRSS